jgi:hypothetical protein
MQDTKVFLKEKNKTLLPVWRRADLRTYPPGDEYAGARVFCFFFQKRSSAVSSAETLTQSSGAIVPVSPLNAALRVIWHDSRERGVR